MPLTLNQKGVTLIELVIAVSMMAAVVASLSLAFPQVSANMASTRQHALANNLVNAQLQTLKSKPYDFEDLTEASLGQFNANCDCAAIPDLSILPATQTPMGGTTYKTASCVGYVTPGNPWVPQCS